jgi:subtilisin family serine protease
MQPPVTQRVRLLFACSALLLGTLIGGPAILNSQGPPTGAGGTVLVEGHEAVAGEVLVRFASSSRAADRAAVALQLDVDQDVAVGGVGARRLRSRRFSVETMLASLRGRPDVVYAEPNYILSTTDTPNDPQFGNLWGLLNIGQQIAGVFGTNDADIDATAAWEISKGSSSVAVGVIDTGIDYTHPDLAANVWSAPTAFSVTVGGVPITCGAGTHGFNAITRTCNPMDDNNHGTHVSGTIGAVGNNGQGVVGVNWTTRIIGGKFLDASGHGSTANAIDAIEFMIQAKAAFAGSNGANVRVLNNSWGGGGFSSALLDEINSANANGMLFAAAAGNAGTNNDVFPFYPANYSASNVIAVAATNNTDSLAWFSNYGSSVDLAAPGDNILSTTIGGTYQFFSGTSMATPQVSGAAALLLSACSLSTANVKATLRANVDVLGSLTGFVDTNGRLNVDHAIRACATPGVPPAPSNVAAFAGDGQVNVTWAQIPSATQYSVKRSTTPGGPYSTIATVTTTAYLDTAVVNGTTYYYVVSATGSGGTGPNSSEVSATPHVSLPAAPSALKAKAGDARVTLSWAGSLGATSYTVKRSLAKSGPYAAIAPGVATTGYVDTGVTNGTTYYYVVTAVNSAGESSNSNKANATPLPAPAVPTGLTASTGANVGEVALSWNPAAAATAYRVKRSGTSGGPYTIIKKVTTTSFVDTGRVSGKRYYYVVSALNSIAESANSTQASALAK